MRKFEKRGTIEHLNTHKGDYGNFIGFQDYHTSLNQILDAEAAFQTIPAKIRAQFQNDPATFLEFAQNPENQEDLVELGLARARPPEPVEGDQPSAQGETPEKPPAAPPEPPLDRGAAKA